MHLQSGIQRPSLGKLFNNKFLTYIATGTSGRGRVVEVEIKVVGKTLTYTYTNVKERG